MKQGYAGSNKVVHAIIEADNSRLCDGKIVPITFTAPPVTCKRCLKQMKGFIPPITLIDKMIESTNELIKAIRDEAESGPGSGE